MISFDVAGRHPVCLPFDKQPRNLLTERVMKGIDMENLGLTILESDEFANKQLEIIYDQEEGGFWFGIEKMNEHYMTTEGFIYLNISDFNKVYEFILKAKIQIDSPKVKNINNVVWIK